MSLNLNEVIIGGRIANDLELKVTPSGVSVTTFSVAVDRNIKSADGERITDFINVVAWRQTAEFITKYFRKGSAICIIGSLQVRSWTDNNGNKRYATEVIADKAKFVESKSSEQPTNSLDVTVEQPNSFEEIPTDDDLPF